MSTEEAPRSPSYSTGCIAVRPWPLAIALAVTSAAATACLSPLPPPPDDGAGDNEPTAEEDAGQTGDSIDASGRMPDGGVSPTDAAASVNDGAGAADASIDGPRVCVAEPTPSPENTFYILPIWEDIRFRTDDEVGREMDKLIAQIGKGNRYHRTGFVSIKPPQDVMERNCRLATSRGLTTSVIFGGVTHDRADLQPTWDKDLRNYQWRALGANWRGYVGNDIAPSELAREQWIPTASRYATSVQNTFAVETRFDALEVAAVIKKYPDCISVINGVIEAELAYAPSQKSDDFLGDYSPFAVTEFRDWLRHQGKYASDGSFAGQGAPSQITGAYVAIDGAMRSPFYDDPTPAVSNGTGKSFNETFGTNFTTWTLRYWDLDQFPAPITDKNFNPTPATGNGATLNGFDAPRVRDDSAYWRAFSWDYDDRGKTYPPGNPVHPAWGFRQVEVHNWVLDQFQVMLKAGLPPELLFAHQIAGEHVINEANIGGPSRIRSSASPLWTGFLPFNGTVGITIFGEPLPYSTIEQYTKLVPGSLQWGIFEWHPLPKIPGAYPDAAAYNTLLKSTSAEHLKQYYDNKVHYLFAGWWQTGGVLDPTFPLNDSPFAESIKSFLASRPDKPYPGYHCP